MPSRARAATIAAWLACGTALLLILPGIGWAGEDPPLAKLFVERPESDLLLLALRLDRSTLAETLPAYQGRGGVLIPLGEVCRLLGLGVTVDLAHGLASGFFLDERRLFSLDLAGERVFVEGQPKRFDPARIEIHSDDIYVDAELLSEWLPLHLSVDQYAATITVRPEEKLPLELRLEREGKVAGLRAGNRRSLPSLPRLELPYRLFDGPIIDQTLRYTRQPGPRGDGRSVVESSTYATGDALFMEANAFVSGTDRGFLDSRFSLARRDPRGNLLGILGAREVVFGDVFHPGLGLIAEPRSGPGFLISNFPLQLQAQFDRQSFRGDLPPGWEAELYRGSELLAYAQSRADGLYEFLDIPLFFGQNVFRVELYGPQGQHRSETSRFNVGDTLTPKGRVYYRLAGNQPDYRLLGTAPADARARSSFDLSAGLTKHLSGSLSLAAVDLADRRHQYGKVALRAFWGFLFANVELAAEPSGGSAWQATAQSRLGAFGLEIQHAQLDGFVSERFLSPSLAPLTRRTRIRLDSAIPETWLPRIPLLFEIREDRLASGERISQLTGRISAFRRGLAVANQLLWSFSSGGGSEATNFASGQLLISKYFQGFSLRGELDYSIDPKWEVTNVAATGERLFRGLLLSGGVSRLSRTGQTRLLAGVNKLEGAFGFGLTGNYSSSEGLGVGALLSVSSARDPRDGGWHLQARPQAGSGAVSGRAFIDANGNGLMDPGELPIPDAGFLLNGAGQLARTGDAGVAFLGHLSPYQDIDLALATSTLEDPFWKPAHEGVRILPRPGKVAVVDFPVLITGEILGTVYLKRDGKNREASGVDLELIDQKGAIVKRVRTAFDGFYDITEVRSGTYTLSVTAEHVVRLRVVGPSRRVNILPNGTVLDGVDFLLQPANWIAPAATVTQGVRPAEPSPLPAPSRVPTPLTKSPLQAPSSASWALQLQSLRDASTANSEANRLSSELARPTRVVYVDLGSRGGWHRVYLIGFATAAEAESERRRLSERGISALRPVRLSAGEIAGR